MYSKFLISVLWAVPCLVSTIQAAAADGATPATSNGLAQTVATLPIISATDAGRVPALKHLASSGASLADLGMAHGLRSVLARKGDQFLVVQVTPDGEAVVAGLLSDLSLARLEAIADGQITPLGTAHGLRGYFVKNGSQFQVFYATPDGERVIPGVMWDATGRDITRDQVARIAGAIPTVVIGQAATPPPSAATAAPLTLVKDTFHEAAGKVSAPRLWVFIDPQCAYSIRAMAALQPYVASGKVQLAVIPLSVLDYENNGQSTASALAMLSRPPGQMVAAWRNRQLAGPPAANAGQRLAANMAVAKAIQLRGTPTFLWRKADGGEGRLDGLPPDVKALVDSIGG